MIAFSVVGELSMFPLSGYCAPVSALKQRYGGGVVVRPLCRERFVNTRMLYDADPRLMNGVGETQFEKKEKTAVADNQG
jgi:hypothetical protein